MSDVPTDADLAALLDQERGAEAARTRSTERWLRQQALEDARLTGLLLTAAEQQSVVVLRTTSGRAHTGAVSLVGRDCVVLRPARGDVLYIRTGAISVVQLDRGVRPLPASDDRVSSRASTLRDLLADQAGDRPDVALVCAGSAESVVGRLLAVGIDVATVELAQRGSVAYVALASVTEVLLRPSG